LNKPEQIKISNFEPYSTVSIPSNTFNSSKEEYLHRINEDSQKLNKLHLTENFWENYEQKTFSWKQWIAFMIPVGLKNKEFVESLSAEITNISNIDGATLFPDSYLYLPISFIGYLKPDDIMWSQVESFYVNASPRMHRIDPFEINAIEIAMDKDTIYVAFDDDYHFKEIRKQLMLGVPHINKLFKNNDSQVEQESDHFLPKIDIAFLNQANQADIKVQLKKVNLKKTISLTVDYVSLVRMASDPQLKMSDPDIIAEIPLMGKEYRTGYHN
tara:strand:- start:959 stop:1771 length:813 start_codon:yes stop_codon:yes gene_type:complete